MSDKFHHRFQSWTVQISYPPGITGPSIYHPCIFSSDLVLDFSNFINPDPGPVLGFTDRQIWRLIRSEIAQEFQNLFGPSPGRS